MTGEQKNYVLGAPSINDICDGLSGRAAAAAAAVDALVQRHAELVVEIVRIHSGRGGCHECQNWHAHP